MTSWHDYPAAIVGRTEQRLLAWFDVNVRYGQTWLDIGAHYGYTAIALSRLVGRDGRVFAFEPMLATAGHLTRTRGLNGFSQLTVLPVALAAPISLNLQRAGSERGMISPTGNGAWAETIVAARLDWLWPQICGESARIDGVKVDVQGMELEVLRGMAELLTIWRPKLIVEVHPDVSRAALLEFLQSIGYRRPGIPIEPVDDELEPQYLDDHSYYFPVG